MVGTLISFHLHFRTTGDEGEESGHAGKDQNRRYRLPVLAARAECNGVVVLWSELLPWRPKLWPDNDGMCGNAGEEG